MNKQDNNDWLKQMKSQLQDYKATPPKEIWENLEQELHHPPRRLSLLNWPMAVAAAVVVLIVVAFFLNYYMSPWEIKKDYVAENTIEKERVIQQQPRKSPEATIEKEMLTSGKQAEETSASVNEITGKEIVDNKAVQNKTVDYKAVDNKITGKEIIGNEIIGKEITDNLETKECVTTKKETKEGTLKVKSASNKGVLSPQPQLIADADVCDSDQTSEAETNNLKNNQNNESKKNKEVRNDKKDYSLFDNSHLGSTQLLAVADVPQKSNRNWGVSLSTSSSAGGAITSNRGVATFGTKNDLVCNEKIVTSSSDQVLFLRDGVPYVKSASDAVEVKHHQPINVAFMVAKQLTPTISIESGLTYTYLSSEVKMFQHDPYLDQKLHYIGLPLRVNWRFANYQKFSFYLSGGGEIEKCLYASFDGRKVDVSPLQFSLSAQIGIQYNISKHLGLYFEPGAAYYFKNSNKLRTIRRDNPFNIKLQGGLRLSY